MNTALLEFSHTVTVLATESDNSLALLLLGPVGAGLVYWGLYRYYRNVDKSHAFEKETLIEAQPVTGSDHKVDTVRGTKRTRINGNNVSNHRSRVQRLN